MKVLVAPNAFKGSLSASQAAAIIARALPKSWESRLCPIADGGDGTLDCLVAATKGKSTATEVTGPIPSKKLIARWGVLGDGRTAVIEMAEAAGLRLLKKEEYAAGRTTTYGVGELLLRALRPEHSRILVALGGSATNDGGAGCATALGVRFLDHRGNVLTQGGLHLRDLHTIDVTGLDKRVHTHDILCLSDVDNRLLGPSGATSMFGRQKGASDEELEKLEEGMTHYANIILRETNIDITRIAGGGAAGGLGAGLVAFCNARIVSGIDYVLDVVEFDELLHDCDLVVTAEGSVDEQSAHGKGVAGIAQRARKSAKPVHVFAGRIRGDRTLLCQKLGVESIYEIAPASLNDRDAMANAEALLGQTVARASAGW